MRGKYPSVTEVLRDVGLGVDYSRVAEPVMEHARQRGQDGHRLIEAHHYGYLEPGELVSPAYLAFLEESGHVPIVSEFEVAHEAWRFCGHPDRLGWLGKVRGLWEWKFIDSLGDLAPVARQLAGYRLAYQSQHPEAPVEFCAAVQFLSTGRYKVHEFTAAEIGTAEQEFLAGVVVYHAKRQAQEGNR